MKRRYTSKQVREYLAVDSNMKIYHWAREMRFDSLLNGKGTGNVIEYACDQVRALAACKQLYLDLGVSLKTSGAIVRKLLDRKGAGLRINGSDSGWLVALPSATVVGRARSGDRCLGLTDSGPRLRVFWAEKKPAMGDEGGIAVKVPTERELP